MDTAAAHAIFACFGDASKCKNSTRSVFYEKSTVDVYVLEWRNFASSQFSFTVVVMEGVSAEEVPS